MPFYVSRADSAGVRIASSDYYLPISPTRVDYPVEAAGSLETTTDGITIQQQPNRDGRPRAWVWANYRDTVPGWPQLWHRLEALRARTLIEAGAATPYIYIKETESTKLRRLVQVVGTASSGSATTLVTGNAWTTNAYAGLDLNLIDGTGAGQTTVITSNTATTLTFPTLVTAPDATTKYEIRGWVYDWFRVRVTDVRRSLRDDGGPTTFPEATFQFVLDDPAYNDLG